MTTVWGGRRWRELLRKLIVPGMVCTYCGKPAQTLDHVLPRSKFPDLSWDLNNLTAACYACNRSKGDRLDWRPIDLVAPGDWWPTQTRRVYCNGSGQSGLSHGSTTHQRTGSLLSSSASPSKSWLRRVPPSQPSTVHGSLLGAMPSV